MKAVIMAGGKGTRIAEINSEVPKPMIMILGKPILEYQIENLRLQGIIDFIIVVGHLGQIIKNHFEDGEEFGVKIEYVTEKEPLGTAGSLYHLKNKITEDFLLLNGDIIFDIDLQRFISFHKKSKGLASVFTHANNHPYDSGIIVSDEKGLVQKWFHKEDEKQWYANCVNAGLHLLSTEIVNNIKFLGRLDLDRDILQPLIIKHQLYAYESPEYVKDMGTPKRYEEVIEDIKKGKIIAKNLHHKQRAIFLDRDGTINKYVGFLNKIEDFELIDGVAEAIKVINESNYLVVVVTNQPVIARGEVSIDQLSEIHNKMETLLGNDGAYVDDIFYCPHHPDNGYQGEVSKYKISCTCRKPKPGMLLEAAEKLNIDLEKSWMVGDSNIDVEAGYNAGCNCAFISNERNCKYTYFENLSDFVNKVILQKGDADADFR